MTGGVTNPSASPTSHFAFLTLLTVLLLLRGQYLLKKKDVVADTRPPISTPNNGSKEVKSNPEAEAVGAAVMTIIVLAIKLMTK